MYAKKKNLNKSKSCIRNKYLGRIGMSIATHKIIVIISPDGKSGTVVKGIV